MMQFLRPHAALIERTDLAGWLCVLGGAALIALAVLWPAYRDVEQLRHQQAHLTTQHDAWTKTLHNYQQFSHAIDVHDPALLQRLAWNQLRQKPAGADPLAPQTGAPTDGYDAWLAAPLHTIPTTVATTHTPQFLLDRQTTQKGQIALIGLGTLAAIFGLVTSLRKPQHA